MPDPYRLALDVSTPEARRAGPRRVARELVRALLADGPQIELTLLATADDAAAWRRWAEPLDVRVREAGSPEDDPVWSWDLDAVCAPAGLSPLARLRPTLVALGREAEALCGGWFDELERADWRARLLALRGADTFVVTRDALRAPVAEALDVPLRRVRVARLRSPAPPSADAVARTRRRHGLARPYLLHTGGAGLAHNLALLLAGYRLLLERQPDADHDLVLALAPDDGGPDDGVTHAELAARVARLGLGGRVHVLGAQDDESLAALQAGSDALICAWLHQGLGLTPLESLQLGRPLLLSTALPAPGEQLDALLRFDARRPDAIAQGLASFACDARRRAALTRAAQAAAQALRRPGNDLAALCLERLSELRRTRASRVVGPAGEPRLSVVTPSFEQAEFLERTLRSVLTQDAPGVEYLVMDGGSRDGTLELLRRHAGALRFVSRPDGGQADAVNRGFAQTRGDILGWLNSDDVYYAGALREVQRFFDAHPETDLLYGDADHVDGADRVLGAYPGEDWDYARLAQACYLCQPAVFLRRRVLARHGALDAGLRYCMDYEYWLRVGPHVRVARLRLKLAGSRLHAGAKTLRARVAVHAEINGMLRRRLGEVPERWLHNYAWAVIDAAGHDRARLEDYAGLLTRATLYAFLRWRGRLPPRRILRTAAGWLREARARRRAARA